MSLRRLPFWAALLAVPVACQDYPFDQKCAESIKEQELSRPAARPTPADILFIVDNSGSMADEQQKLAASFDQFINEIAGTGDYRIAVVTTDQSTTAGEQAGLFDFTFATTPPNNLIGSSNAGCSPAGIALGCFRGPDAPTRVIDSSVLARDQQIARFQQNVLVGSCGSGTEEGLKAMVAALGKTGGGECNSGFLRPDANLVVVIVSDEEDQSSGTPVQQFVNDLTALKPAAQIRVAVIVGSVDGQGSNCSINEAGACGSLCRNMPPQGSHQACSAGNPCSSSAEFCMGNQCESRVLENWNNTNCGWCSYYDVPDCCSALAGRRYVDFANQMEERIRQSDSNIADADCRGAPGTRVGCLIDTICQDNFGPTLARIARDLVISTEYNLNPKATYVPGVRAKVSGGRFGEGVELTPGEDFAVNDEGTKLTLTAGDKTPGAGETLDIYYVSEVTMNNNMPRGACK